jgi:hypothetical protein
MSCEWNVGQSFFILVSLIPASIFLSSWVVAKFIWLPWVEKLNEMPEPEIPFVQQNLITDEDIENLNENKDYNTLKDKTIIEESPDGPTFFRYNHDSLGFEYWCDKKLSYKILESIARKYVKKFSSVDLYIDRRDMIEKYIKKKNEELEKEKEPTSQVFASFKKYNKGDGNSVRINKKEIPTAEKANKYIFKGKFKESPKFIKEKEEKKKEKAKKIKKTDWNSWFNLNSDSIHKIKGED